ncbi:MAG: prephenate dehydratase [Deltaproteobacteria bacterium]|nr:prephenate dehydratase [Deltaproteobacteria bacterium]
MTRVVGIRGATTVEADSLEEILDATQDMLVRLQELNGFSPDDLASILFTTTHDLRSTFPARAARRLGWVQVPMLCTHEVDAPSSVPRCIRVLLHWNTDRASSEVRHAYFKQSRVLRPDWAIPPLSGPAGAITAPEDPLRESVVAATPVPVAVTPTPAAPPRSAAPLDLAPVSFQGEPGAYSQEAIFGLLGSDTTTLPCLGFRGAFEAVHQGRAKSALLPVENSTTGSIHEVWDLLMTHDLPIVGEVILPVRHALLALPGTTIGDIRTIVSHPQALYQCEGWIGSHGWRAEPGTDTAGAARRVAEAGDKTRAAIASPLAAELYGLEVLAKNIQDIPDNFTRFVLIVPRAAFVLGGVAPGYAADAKVKTSLVFAARHVAGSLYGCLAEFAVRDVSLAKIESRPDRRTPWSYIFYVDIEGDPAEPRVAQSLAALSRHASFVRVLGTYPSRSLRP